MHIQYKIVIGMSILGGIITSVIIYVGGLFSSSMPIVAEELTATLPPPKVSTFFPTALPPTSTPIPTPTEEPILRARLSHYWPKNGPPNCHSATWTGTECTSILSDGDEWQHWSYFIDWGMACPIEFPLGTKMLVEGFGTGIWTCVDRGSAIQRLPDGTFFLDLLTKKQPWISPDMAETIYDKYSPSGNYVVKVKVMK